jgi:hypothetical protein
MFTGYLMLGCTEILSRARAYGYTRTAECPVGWLRLPECGDIAEALGESVYNYANIAEAPWYDADDESTARFLGAYPTRIDGITDSTRTASIVEGIRDGGIISGLRHAVRTMRIQAILIGIGEDALEAGLSWLDAALQPETCNTHGASCGEVDATFFAACPPGRDDYPDLDAEGYEQLVEGLIRNLHGVVAVSGPTVIQKMRRANIFGYLVEFTLAAGNPFVYSLPQPVDLAPTTPVVLQDAPLNLVPYPSAELASGEIVVAKNLSRNPGVEVSASLWGTTATAFSGSNPAPYLTGGQNSVDGFNPSPSGGPYVMRARLLGNGTTVVSSSVADMVIYQDIFESEVARPGARLSFSVWAAFRNYTVGSAVLHGLLVEARWMNGSTVISTNQIGATTSAVDYEGRAFSLTSVPVPAGADRVRVWIRGRFNWNSGPTLNSDVRLYADALNVSVP